MKCEEVLDQLEEYLDGELGVADQEHLSEHLITCANCAEAFATLTAEQEMFARYDREIEVSPALWNGIAGQIAPVEETSYGWWMKIAAMVILTIGLGSVYFLKKEKVVVTTTTPRPLEQEFARFTIPKPEKKETRIKRIKKPVIKDNPDVLSSDVAYLDIDDQETVDHIEKTQNLLRSIRNFVSDGDEEIDVTYDKALSQRLLNENVVLRREAEMKAKFPTKTLLADLEPLLIDIANLPDHARPEEMRVIKERVEKTEIVAALAVYRDRGANNR